MQGLVHYADDSSPEPEPRDGLTPVAGPSRLRDTTVSASSAVQTLKSSIKVKRQSGVTVNSRSPATSATSSTKRQRRSSPPSFGHAKDDDLPENLTHTSQSALSRSELAGGDGLPSRHAGSGPLSELEGLDPDEVVRTFTRPPDLPGVDDWGIPPAVDPSLASEALKAKVQNFLRLKHEQGEHINTRLLSSSAFANPHIYSRLVEFVDIDERATAFPESGWLTRRNLESLVPTYGPRALAEAQKTKQEAVKASQASGSRREIGFAPAKHKDREDRGDRGIKNGWDRGDRGKDRDQDRYGVRERAKDRKRDRR
ncbi:hypothetical protein IAU60_006308 [Kwoniella sp. DSM 27419]